MFQKVMGIFFFSACLNLTPGWGINACRAEIAWEQINAGNNELNIRSLSVSAENPDYICAAGAKQLYLSRNSGLYWEEIFSLQGQAEEINFVAFDTGNASTIYTATTAGLFVAAEQGKQWVKTFKKVNDADNDVRWIAQDERGGNLPGRQAGMIYLGTRENLYQSEDSGDKWKKVNGGLPQSTVRAIAFHPVNAQVLYLANTMGLFKSIDNGLTWARIYVTSYKAAGNGEEDADTLPEEGQDLINCIAVNKNNPKEIFIAAANGVYYSADAGEVWKKLPEQGLTCGYVNYIVMSKQGILYAATKKGVFRYNVSLNRWDNLYTGMTALETRSLAIDNRKNYLFAATGKGIYRAVVENTDAPDNRAKKNGKINIPEEKDVEEVLKQITANEPTIQQVQEAALKYGEIIHPQSIKNSRRGARLKGLFPTVSVDYDKSIEEGGTGTNFGRFATGPLDWGVSLSWDVGDLIFNEQLRLIDSNTRLAVQLRDDILNEVTRLYYERQKLRTELALNPPEKQDDKLTKLLRAQELTANIDALTGGYFSGYSTGRKKESGNWQPVGSRRL